jgi:hypothetical protein
MTARMKSVSAALVALALTAAPGRAATPLDDLVQPVDDKTACFTRVYDAAHLKAHPKQKTTSMTVWLRYDKAPDATDGTVNLGMALGRRGDSRPFFAQGSCIWTVGGNRDISDRPVVKVFKKNAGGSCSMFGRPDVFDVLSAEEGGELIIDRGKDKDTLMVYLDSVLAMVRRTDRANSTGVVFGADDRVFQLSRTDAKNCATVEEAVTEPAAKSELNKAK